MTGLARGRFGRIAPERIARHIIGSQRDADWAVQKAAFDALARRYAFAQRDGLHVAERPEHGILGSYRTSSAGTREATRAREPTEDIKRGNTRPYETALYAIEPLRASCACPDFVRSSLGLCKHGLTVLELLEQRGLISTPATASEPAPAVGWDYAEPLAGPFDRLARLRVAPELAAVSGAPDPETLLDLPKRLQLIQSMTRALADGQRAEPAVHTLLAEERARAEQRLSLAPHLPRARAALAECKRELYPYQQLGVQRFLERGRLLLADDMGLGKTTQAVAACHALLAAGCIARVLLIVPTPLKLQWKREWESTSREPLSLVEGSPKERKRLYRQTHRGVLVIGYEQLLRDFEHVQGFAAELVVLDEAQRIKNWATKSAAYVKSLAPAYRLVLTGTPMENRFDELASIMDFVDDLALEPKWRLVPYHSVLAPGDKSASGARNLDVLRARLAPAMLRRTRGAVLDQLPARTDTRVPVELTDQQRSAHDELQRPIAEILGRAAQRGLAAGDHVRLMQLLTMQRMICNGMAQVQFDSEWPRCEHEAPTQRLLDGLFSPKLSVLRGLIEQVVVEQRRKVVVFSQWRKLLRFAHWAVQDVLAGAGMRALFFTGAESQRQRQDSLAAFQDDASASVLFSSDAGAVGLNLQHAASCCINLELPWNPAVLEQRIARIHRLGQTQPIDVYNLVTEDGIEGRIARLLEQKQALFSTLFDGDSDEVRWSGQSGLVESVKQLVDLPQLPLAAAGDGSDLEPEPLLPAVDAESPEPQPRAAVSYRERLAQLGVQITRLHGGSLRVEASAALADRVEEALRVLVEGESG